MRSGAIMTFMCPLKLKIIRSSSGSKTMALDWDWIRNCYLKPSIPLRARARDWVLPLQEESAKVTGESSQRKTGRMEERALRSFYHSLPERKAMRTLVVEDDTAVVEALRESFQDSGLDIDYATDGETALKKLPKADLLVTDLRLPGMDGTELLQEARRRKPEIEVVIMTAYGTIPSAVEAMRRGARAYLTKPFNPEELIFHIRTVEETLKLREMAFRFSRGELVGASLLMQKVYQEIDLAAASDSPVLITGETGTGKELAARAIHELSPRKNGPFIAVNMGALPKDLVESELFGREKGAFTGADTRKRGRFTLAQGGTLFLDEL